VDCAEFKSDICKGWKICLDLLLKGVQHLGGFHFFESDSLVECSQKFRVFAEHGSCNTDLTGKLSEEAFFHLFHRNVRSGLALEKIEIVGFSSLKISQATIVFPCATQSFQSGHKFLIGGNDFCFHETFVGQDQSSLF